MSSISPPEQHALNAAKLASVESTLASKPLRSQAPLPVPSTTSTPSISSAGSAPAVGAHFTHSPGPNPLLSRQKLKKAPPAKKKKAKSAAVVPPAAGSADPAQLADAVERAQADELKLLDSGVPESEAGQVINLADELLAQLDMRQGHQPELSQPKPAPPSALSPVSSSDSAEQGEHEHHHSISQTLHDAKEAVKEAVSGSPPSEAQAEKKVNRQQARKLRKQQAVEQTRAAAEAEVAAENDHSVEEERLAIEAGCKQYGVRVKEIDPDGHCLYASIADQVNLHKLSTRTHKETYLSTRHAAAETMRQFPDEFLPFLESAEEADGLMGEAEYARYCDTVEKTGEWGGHPEIKALSKYFQTPIYIIQQGTKDAVKVEDPSLPQGRGPLLISYHRKMYGLGEHYNSLVPAANPAANVAPTIAPLVPQ